MKYSPSSSIFVLLSLLVVFVGFVQCMKEGQPVYYSPPISSSTQQLKDSGTYCEDKGVLTTQEAHLSQRGEAEPGPDYRLPTNLIPVFYQIVLRPIIDRDYPGIGEKNTAPGVVFITLNCIENTNKVVLHSKFIKIIEESIIVHITNDSSRIPVLSVEYDEQRDFLIINLEGEIQREEQVGVGIEFIANVPPNDSLRGLYSEEYFDPLTNQTKVMAVTQLEPLRARQVFPCLDEPTYKSQFFTVLARTENFTTLANGPILFSYEDSEFPGWHYDVHFHETPMPTYLFAIAVADYSYTEASPELYHLPVKVHGPRHLVDIGKSQLTTDVSAMLMKHFEERYGVPHNMPKVDSISVPYKRGAMENYGLITYGESYLMYHEGTTTTTELRGMQNIIGHELGHQWFGNLVTCKWWSDIWLNEGFASYVSFTSQNALWPEFGMLTNRVAGSVNGALRYDAGPSSHPIHQDAWSAEQIARNMDTIAYDKGASIVALMVSFLGETTFYSGITQYLKNHYDSVAEQEDLFRALEEAANEARLELPKSVTEIMYTWTLQKGFPLVRVNLRGSDVLSFSQEPWENANVRNETSRPSTAWDIPVKYLIEAAPDSGQVGSFWLLKEEQSKNLTVADGNAWILANPDAGGFYRTLYDEELTSRIAAQLLRNHSVISPEARVRLLDDYFTSAYEKYIPMQTALEFTKFLHKETDQSVWQTALTNLEKARNLYRNLIYPESLNALEASLGKRILEVLFEILETIDETKPSSTLILRGQLAEWLCLINLEFSWCDLQATRLYTKWRNDPTRNPIHPDIQSSMYCKIVEGDFSNGFEWILQQYLNTTDAAQKSRLSSALACTKNEEQIKELLNDLILSPIDENRKIEKAHATPALQRLLTHTLTGILTTLTLFVEEPNRIPDYFDRDVNSVTGVLSAVSSHYAMSPHLDMVKAIEMNNTEFYGNSIKPIIASIESNLEWLETFQEDMTSWLVANPHQ